MANSRKILHYFLLILHFPLHISIDTLHLNKKFKEGDLLVSRNNKFAFGFFRPGISNNIYVGVWFHKITEPSVVWVANRNSPIKSSPGFLLVTEDGNIALYNNPDKKFILWSTNVSGEVNNPCYVHLLDSGNLVLVHGINGRIVWQSFDYPTDTRLPGMKLGKNTNTGLEWSLTSWKSADDPGIGEFSVKIDPRALQIFLYKKTRIIWRGYLWPVRNFSNLYSYKISLGEEERNTVYYINDDSILNRQIVDHTGMLRWLRWSEIDGKWKEFWSVPIHPCEVYSHCGVNGKCSSSNSDVFQCSCLPGYEPKTPGEWYLRDASGGCKRKRGESSGVCRKGDGFLNVEDVKFPDTGFLESGDVGFRASLSVALLHMNVSRVKCELECLRNCSCSAYASVKSDGETGFGCLTWYGELVDTLDRVGSGIDLYVRVDAIELAENTETSKMFLGMGFEILVFSVISAWVTIVVIVYLLIRRKKRVLKLKAEKRIFDPALGSIYYKNTLVASELRQSNPLKDLPFFDFGTIVAATNNFSTANKLGQGGFGIVYKGELYDGLEVAVKRLSENSGQGIEEFKNEVMLIAKLQHKNLVKLLGCCIDREERILVYEYMPNKSLDSFLFDQTRRSLLDWRKRVDIITGIARGILYLHQDSRLPIIHRDLKCSNILLDANMNPKISDFGMARIFKDDQVQEKTKRVVGTYGYMSPEYALFGKFSVKSDVFGFGIILLEIITAKKNSGFQGEDTNCSTLIGYVWELWRQGKVKEIVDFSIEEGSYNLNEALRCIQIGLLCVEENAVDRPSISEVILMLSSEIALPSPKQPAFHYRISSSCNGVSQLRNRGSNSTNEVTITAFLAR